MSCFLVVVAGLGYEEGVSGAFFFLSSFSSTARTWCRSGEVYNNVAFAAGAWMHDARGAERVASERAAAAVPGVLFEIICTYNIYHYPRRSGPRGRRSDSGRTGWRIESTRL